VLFAYRINEGHFGEPPMEGLKVVILASLVGNVWAGAKLDAGVIFDASADDQQRRGLELIFTGKAGGWMGQFSQTIRTVTGVEYAVISVKIDRSLERWRVAIPDLVGCRRYRSNRTDGACRHSMRRGARLAQPMPR
jgi:hypothetical protein